MGREELIQIGAESPAKHAASPQQQGTLYLRTFGCQMNEYDSQKIIKSLESRYRLVDSPAEAQLIIINTCSVREKPEQKLYSMLGEFAELKQNNPSLIVGVGGCVAQQEGAQIIKRGTGVDFVFGTHNISLVPKLIESRRAGLPPQVAVDYREDWEILPEGFPGASRVSVFVAISRGCNKNCTYCIVPTTRGPEVSRSLDEILKEIRIAVHRGAREVVLLGQTVNSWGKDFTPRSSFTKLVEEISKIEQLYRIRFTSPHPQEVSPEFIELFRANPKVCRHIHMPLQSGSDRILKAMNRNYRIKRYLDIIERIRQADPTVAITTDVIVGFPGESEEDFQQTVAIMEQVRFDSSYSFMFSPRPGTKAAALPDDVSPEEKLRRLKHYQQIQDQISFEILRAQVGSVRELLVEGPSRYDSGKLQGRTSQGVVVNLIDADQADLEPGQLIDCKIEEWATFTLRGSRVRGSGIKKDALFSAPNQRESLVSPGA